LLKAMHKDRARRYQSADALGADVRHFLAGEPIEARRDSATYVVQETCKRAGRGSSHRDVDRHHRLGTADRRGLVAMAYHFKPLRMYFRRMITTRVEPLAEAPLFQNVRMIAIRDGTDFGRLPKPKRLNGVRNGSEKDQLQSRDASY
jgi:hypothetical protein